MANVAHARARVEVTAPEDDVARWRREAELDGRSLASWVRQALNELADASEYLRATDPKQPETKGRP